MIRHFRRHIHCIGIGGAGMSGLAELLLSFGHRVSGSDSTASTIIDRLQGLGIAIQIDHIPQLVNDADLVIFSSAIRSDNPERIFAQEHGIPELRRAEALGELMRSYQTICIAGTHGKTTTTSLIGAILIEAQMRPTVLIGGTLRREGSPLVLGEGSVLVAEADEYDRSFLAMSPFVALITNIEADHLDCYADLDDIKKAFGMFISRIPFYGTLVCCADDPGVRALMAQTGRRCITYGRSNAADYAARSISFDRGIASFALCKNDLELGRIVMSIPGMHNVSNATGAAAVALEMGAPFEAVRVALAAFSGVKRRFEIVGRVRDITVIDDYAHHPGEIAATLDAALRCGFTRITAVFQPHLFTRTRDFMDGFVSSLAKADTVLVTAIYKAREEPIEGINAETIVEKLRLLGHADAHYCSRKEIIPGIIACRVARGEAIVVMGAGDITQTAGEIVEALRNG